MTVVPYDAFHTHISFLLALYLLLHLKTTDMDLYMTTTAIIYANQRSVVGHV